MLRRQLLQSALSQTPVAARSLAWLCTWPLLTAQAKDLVPMPKIGEPWRLPDAPLINGGVFEAAKYKDQVVVVYWWASWCPFCALQSPLIQKLWDTQRARGLMVLGVSIDRKVEQARQYMTQKGYTFASTHLSPELEKLLPKPGKGLPETVVRGRDGRVVMAESGQLFAEDVEQIARFL